MKRFVASFILGAMLLPVSVGCGNPSTPTKPSTTGTGKETPKAGTGTEKPKDSTEKPKTNP
jgi:hypothetical protein